MDVEKENKCVESSGIDEVKQIAKTFDIDDINLIKPGIGEATKYLEGMSLEDVGKEETDEIEVEEIQIEN